MVAVVMKLFFEKKIIAFVVRGLHIGNSSSIIDTVLL